MKALESTYESIHNKDYDHEVDRKVAKALFPLYAEMIPANQRPSFIRLLSRNIKAIITNSLMICMITYFC